MSLLSFFADGYTYMMFYSACMVIWIIGFITKGRPRKILITKALPIILISALISYFIHTSYVGVAQYSSTPISFFGGWGVDLVRLKSSL
jgi:hypothetical protein